MKQKPHEVHALGSRILTDDPMMRVIGTWDPGSAALEVMDYSLESGESGIGAGVDWIGLDSPSLGSVPARARMRFALCL